MSEQEVLEVATDNLLNPFEKSLPDAIATGRCGICHQCAYRKYIECRSLDSEYAPLYMCMNCTGLYNATAEFNELDVVEWQRRWADDPEFYKVPAPEVFNASIDEADVTFHFFENDLGIKFSGTYLEIGAGSGVMAAAALRHFSEVHVLDHVEDRLLQVKAIVGDNYKLATFDSVRRMRADVVLIWHAMEHFLDPGGVFKLSADALTPGGHLLMQVPVLSEEHVYPGHYHFYNEVVFETLASTSGLRVLKFYYDHAMNAMTVALQKPI